MTQVFETSSVELGSDVDHQDDARIRIEEHESSDEDPPQVRVNTGREIFSSDITVNEPDFCGTVEPQFLRYSGYTTRRETESLEERLTRIAQELDEISNAEPENPRTNILQQQLRGLIARYDTPVSSTSDDLHQLVAAAQPESGESLRQDIVTANSTRLATTRQTFELEERIKKIEAKVGQSVLSSETSISSQILDLSKKISLCFHPEYNLDTVKHGVEKLADEVASLESRQRVVEITSQSDIKIDEISPQDPLDLVNATYKLALEASEINKQVPSIIIRLRLLSTLHAELANSIDVTSHLDTILREINKDITVWNSSIDALQEQILAFKESFERNHELLERQIENVTLRLASLGA